MSKYREQTLTPAEENLKRLFVVIAKKRAEAKARSRPDGRAAGSSQPPPPLSQADKASHMSAESAREKAAQLLRQQRRAEGGQTSSSAGGRTAERKLPSAYGRRSKVAPAGDGTPGAGPQAPNPWSRQDNHPYSRRPPQTDLRPPQPVNPAHMADLKSVPPVKPANSTNPDSNPPAANPWQYSPTAGPVPYSPSNLESPRSPSHTAQQTTTLYSPPRMYSPKQTAAPPMYSPTNATRPTSPSDSPSHPAQPNSAPRGGKLSSPIKLGKPKHTHAPDNDPDGHDASGTASTRPTGPTLRLKIRPAEPSPMEEDLEDVDAEPESRGHSKRARVQRDGNGTAGKDDSAKVAGEKRDRAGDGVDEDRLQHDGAGVRGKQDTGREVSRGGVTRGDEAPSTSKPALGREKGRGGEGVRGGRPTGRRRAVVYSDSEDDSDRDDKATWRQKEQAAAQAYPVDRDDKATWRQKEQAAAQNQPVDRDNNGSRVRRRENGGPRDGDGVAGGGRKDDARSPPAKRQRQTGNTQLFVGDLPQSYDSSDLAQAFSRFGVVINARVMGTQCFGFVTMATAAGAQLVMDVASGLGVTTPDGHKLRVSWAQGQMPEWKKGPAVYRSRAPGAGPEGLEAYEHPKMREARLKAAGALDKPSVAAAHVDHRRMVVYDDV